MRRNVAGPTPRHASEYESIVTCRDCGAEITRLQPAESIARKGQTGGRVASGTCTQCGRAWRLQIVEVP